MEGVVHTIYLLLIFLIFLVSYFFLFKERNNNPRLPPGFLGLPLIGNTLSFDKALKSDMIEEWFRKGMRKYGPIWKASLYGYPTVLLHGTAANKFLFTYDGTILTAAQPPSFTSIMGSKCISEMTGDDHKRVRSAVVTFLKVDVLKQYVVKLDEEIQHHLETHWYGKHEIQVQSLMKILTFNVTCSLLFGLERGPKRENLLPLFEDMIKATFSIPINLPFTQLNRGIIARKKIVPMIVDLIHEKREALDKQEQVDRHKDLITLLVSIGDNDSSLALSDEEIIDLIVLVMIAGYDTTSSLITTLVKLLANKKSIYSTILQEQEEILKSKSYGEALTWEDLNKMKYTWRVASEMLRITPPVPVNFRRAAQDIEFGGYIIPKGWQVLVCAANTHMEDRIFKNPTMFNPSRFEKDVPSPPAFSLVPFGAGPRMCPGMELAKMETLALIHHLVTKFTWELVKKEESFKRVPVPEFDHGLLVRINPIGDTLERKA